MDTDIHYVRGSRLRCLGALDNDRLLLLMGRSNVNKAALPLLPLLHQLHAQGFTIIWYEGRSNVSQQWLAQQSRAWLQRPPLQALLRLPLAGRLLQKLVKSLLLLGHPPHWHYFLAAWRPIACEVRDLQRLLHDIAAVQKQVYIVSHSAGGRIASLACDRAAIRKIVCFGYPFRHPQRAEEAARTRHLAQLRTPLFIIQGRDDEYGSEAACRQYPLSAAVQLRFIDADHDYQQLSPALLDELGQEIRQFFGSK